jgi:glycosyltransferase involved in cell wall biosynthesis
VIRIFERVQRVWDGKLIFAGQPLSEKHLELVRAHGLAERVIQVSNADNTLLEALYNRAHALLFPSRFEGFGWPILEAQSCGCPVICSDRCSFPEVGGAGALYRDVDDEAGFANDILRLCDPGERNKWVARGLQNVRGFAADKMVDQYVRLYEEELSARM